MKDYKVGVRFYQLQIGYLTIPAETEDEAKAKAITMMEKHKEPEIVDVVESKQAPSLSVVTKEISK